MASFTQRLKVVIDVVSQGATKGLSDFRTEVAQADTFTGKLRAGAKNLGSTLGSFASSPLGAAGGLSALGAAAFNAADQFSGLAKTAIDLSKATALTTEEASRWIAVADDFGIGADELQAGLGRIARTLDSPKWAEYGIATRNAAGEALSANAIFLDALDVLARTTNETERARIGNDLFGKGYAAIAPLVGQTRDEYQAMLDSVDEGQVITAGEAEAGEKWRLAMDKLKESLGGVTLALGEMTTNLAPTIEKVATLVSLTTKLFQESDPNSGLLNDFNTALEGTDKSARAAAQAFRELDYYLAPIDNSAGNLDLFANKFRDLAKASPELAQQVYDGLVGIAVAAGRGDESAMALASSMNLTTQRLAELAALLPKVADGQDDMSDATDENAEAVKRQRDAFEQANRKMSEQLELKRKLYGDQRDAIERQRDYNDAQVELVDVMGDANATTDDQLDAIIKLSEGFGTLTGASLDSEEGTKRQIYQLDELLKGIDPSSPLYKALADYITQLKNIPTNVDTQLRLNVIGAVTTKDGDMIGFREGPRALGGPVDAGSVYQVGEGGRPELLTDAFGRTYLIPGSNGVVTPIGGTAGTLGGGGNVTFNITVTNPMMSGEQLANELKAFISRNGAGWLTR